MIHDPILWFTIPPTSHDPTQDPNFDNLVANNIEKKIIEYFIFIHNHSPHIDNSTLL